MAERVPAPWVLKGTGFILLYRFPRELPALSNRPWFRLGPHGPEAVRGPSAVVVADYRSSPAGPYRELLFIPGKFRLDGRTGYSITRIYVTTESSRISGRRNWGIPKERTSVELRSAGRREMEIVAGDGGTPIFRMAVRRRAWLPPLPAFLPPPGLRLLQRLEGRIYSTRFRGSGRLRFLKLDSISAAPELFPDLSAMRPFAVLQAEDFTLRFEAAETHPDPDSRGGCL